MRRPGKRRLLSVVLFALLGAFMVLTAQQLSLGDFINGLTQPGGKAQTGSLPGLAWEERWLEPQPGELSFWACGAAQFTHGYAKGTLRFENPAANPYTLIFELSLTLDGAEAVIYRSPALPPGSCLDGDKLSRPLKPGEYEAVCLVYAYGEDLQTPVARSAGQGITLTVGGKN